MELKNRLCKILLGAGLALLLGFAPAGPAAAVTVTVDFDALDTSSCVGGGRVSGAPLDAYLNGFGITITNVTGDTTAQH